MRALVVAVMLLGVRSAAAGSFRGGAVWWRVPDPLAAPSTVELTITTIWDQPTTDVTSAELDLGDGTVTTVVGPVTYSGTTRLGAGYAVQQATVTHAYAGSGTYAVALGGCCRHATANNTDGTLPFKLSATVALGTGMVRSPPALTLAATMTHEGKPGFRIPVTFGDAPAPVGRSAVPVESGLEIPQLPDGEGVMVAPQVRASPFFPRVEVEWRAFYAPGASYELAFVIADGRGGSSALDVIAEVTPGDAVSCEANTQEIGNPPGQELANSGSISGTASGFVATVANLPPGAVAAANDTNWWFAWTPGAAELATYQVGLVELASPSGARGECGVALYVMPQVDECATGTAGCAPTTAGCKDEPWGARCTCNGFFVGDGKQCTAVCGSTGDFACIDATGHKRAETCCGNAETGSADCVCDGDTEPPPSHGGCDAGGGAGAGLAAVLVVWRRRRSATCYH